MRNRRSNNGAGEERPDEIQESFLKKYNGNKSAEEFIGYQRYDDY